MAKKKGIDTNTVILIIVVVLLIAIFAWVAFSQKTTRDEEGLGTVFGRGGAGECPSIEKGKVACEISPAGCDWTDEVSICGGKYKDECFKFKNSRNCNKQLNTFGCVWEKEKDATCTKKEGGGDAGEGEGSRCPPAGWKDNGKEDCRIAKCTYVAGKCEIKPGVSDKYNNFCANNTKNSCGNAEIDKKCLANDGSVLNNRICADNTEATCKRNDLLCKWEGTKICSWTSATCT